MKYFKRSSMYKSSTGNVTFNPDTVQAYSYGWWCFVKRIRGRTVFNSYRYSNTTSKHQSKVRTLMRDLGLEIDLIVNVRGGLQHLETMGQVREAQDATETYLKERAESRRLAKNTRARELRARRKREASTVQTKTYPPLRLVK